MNGPPGGAQTPAPGCPVVPEKFESDPDCVSRTAGRVAPADRRGFPLELAPTSPPSVGASPPRKHAHRPPAATSFFFGPEWTDRGSGTAKSLRAHLTWMSGSQDLRSRPLSIAFPWKIARIPPLLTPTSTLPTAHLSQVNYC